MNVNYKNIYYPPGGILLWIIIFIEVLTFTLGISVLLYQKSASLVLFSQSQSLLNPLWGTVNTIVLITGGFMMATSLRYLRLGNNKYSLKWIRGAAFMSFLFLIIKGFEYFEKINEGLTIDYDSFFMFYWLLTGFHYVHVLVALVIILLLARGIRRGEYSFDNTLDVESGAAFWHMCDLIWILLFPVLYLMK